MSDTRLYTERDLVTAMRDAYVRGRYDELNSGLGLSDVPGCKARGVRISDAEREFPFPKITRHRVMMDDANVEWRMYVGSLQWRKGGPWARTQDYANLWVTPDRIAIWSDLLANPTEEVEDGGDA